MSKRADRLTGVCFLFLFCIGCLFFLCAPADAAQRGNQRPGGAPLFLVLPFQISEGATLGKSAQDLPITLEDRLMGHAIRSVPHSAMVKLLTDKNISSIDSATARRLAAEIGATHALYGSINQVGDVLSVDARVVPAHQGNPIPVYVEKHGLISSVTPAVDELAKRVAGIFIRKGELAGVEVRGTRLLDPEVILSRVSVHRGDALDPTAIDADVKRIWDLGYFDDVQINIEQRAQGPVLIYQVSEKPRIDSIAVEGSKEISEEDILAAMGSKTGAVLNEKQLATDIQTILELYRKKGFFSATVNYQTMTRPAKDATAVVIKVNEGKEQYIRKIAFTGVHELSEGDLRDEMLLSERTIFSWITGSGILKEEIIERDSAAISTYYMNHGFMDVVVGVPTIDQLEDGIALTFPITEGQRYKLGTVSFDGDLIDKIEQLDKVTQLDKLAAKNDYFNLEVMQDDIHKLTELYADRGYAFAEIDAVPTKHDGIVDIAYQLVKRQKTYIRRVNVEGNVKTRDNVVLREMRVTDGEPFAGYKLRRSIERLNKLGYFDSVETELVPTEHEDEADLKIKLKERPTGALMAGVGYSTFSKVGVSGTLMESNLWGKGYNVSLQAATSGRRDAVTFSFTNPRVNDTNWAVGTDIYHWRDDYIDYRKRTSGGVLRFGYPLGEYTGLGFGYRLDFYKLYDLDHDASRLIRKYANGSRVSSVAFARVTRDTTDNLRPTHGNIDRLGVEYGGGLLAGDDDFITVTAEHQTYYELMRNHVLHGRVKGSAIFTNGSKEVPVFERFWMGGIDSVRGYDSRDIVPRDKESNDRIGGTRMAFANLEYIWTFSNELGLNLVPFFDIGFNIDADHSYKWSDEIKKSVGAELRWRSPMGDLRFAYGFPLDEDRKGKRNKSGRFEFSMGRFF